jgi:hypothetical protein
MSQPAIARIVWVLADAAVLLRLEQGLDVTLYIALPLAIVVYCVVKLAFSLSWGRRQCQLTNVPSARAIGHENMNSS